MEKVKMIIGIDPGLQGAITFLEQKVLRVYDLKSCIADTGTFHSLDPCLFRSLLTRAINNCPVEDIAVYCEESLLIPGNGIKTSRIVYDSRGVMRTVFLLGGLDVNYVAPVTWKTYFNLKKATKSDSVDRILQYYPNSEHIYYRNFRNKKILMDGRAESTLIALYGQSQQYNNYAKKTK
ncbi:MAG: hypothetical protein LBL62_07150 [Planctomycetaceae bacterium]|jgi:hypothetical protein|nr:hypothetical protein [Planctomycetaceae bacterium]